MATTYYVDLVGGSDAANGLSFANRKLTISSATAAATAGDTVRVMGYAETNTGVTITTTTDTATATLSGAVTKDFDMCETAWTAGTGITSTADAASFKQGTKGQKTVVGGTYVNGTNAILKDLGSTQDFSGYQVVNFWLLTTVAFAASDWSMVLYSDAGGTTAVQTINLPAIAINQWVPVVINTGAALNGTVRSVGFVRNAGATTPTFYLDCVFASKAVTASDCITLQSIVSTKTAQVGVGATIPMWYMVRAITGTTIVLTNEPSTSGAASKVHVQAETNAALYVQRVIEVAGQTNSGSGSATGGDITISGGWNSTDMSTQVGMTAMFVQYGASANTAMTLGNAKSYVTFEKFAWLGGNIAASSMSNGINYMTINNCIIMGYGAGLWGSNNTGHGNWNVNGCQIMANSMAYYVASNGPNTLYNCIFSSCDGNGVAGAEAAGYAHLFVSCLFTRGAYGIYSRGTGWSTAMGGRNVYRNCYFDNNVTADIYHGGNDIFLDNCSLGSSTEVSLAVAFQCGAVYSTNHDVTSGNHQQFFYGGKIISDATTRHTASGIAWKLSPTSTGRNGTFPLKTKIATVYCVSGVQTTVSAYFAKDHANISVGLFIRGGQLGGPASDTTQLSTCGTGATYESTATQIQWTPTSTGWVEIEAICYTSSSTTSNGWVDDFNCVYG